MLKTKEKFVYRCAACGAEHARWQGRCDGCGEWSTLSERPAEARAPVRAGDPGPVPLPEVLLPDCVRLSTGFSEFDRVLGGGLVAGSAVLLAGDPGVGKSTLLLAACAGLAKGGRPVLYVSGEESPSQTRLRAARLSIDDARIHVLAETDLATILAHAGRMLPSVLVVDSIQTVRSAEGGTAGSPNGLRDAAAELTRFAKASGVAVILIGHVTKTGEVAGPMALAHVVDAVLSFEGDRYQSLRVLRALKNRFGSAEEIGLFAMRGDGLAEAADGPGNRPDPDRAEPGSVLTAAAEGTRVLLLEVQALTAPVCGDPRRRVSGLDPRRVELLAAVLAKKQRLALAHLDVFASIAGGVRVEEPGTDLAAALAIASSALDRTVPGDLAAFGEVGLLGEVRPVPRARARLAECARFKVGRALVPPGTEALPGIQTVPVADLGAAFLAAGLREEG